MKRVNHLMPLIADMDNLREAFLLASRGKSLSSEVIKFREELESNLLDIHQQLLDGTYTYGTYRTFTIYDPKQRTICAAPFRERVTFHAMMRVCHRLFDDFQVSVSYASRVGRGTYLALEKAQQYCRHYRWFLKMDVTKYFDSIDHEVMKSQLKRMVKDPLLLYYWDKLIDGYHTSQGKGLPIGNLTSQYFANHYLAVADHYAKEQVGIGPMVRYMDDIVIWGSDKTMLLQQGRQLEHFIESKLRLDMHPFCVNQTIMGLPFLGYVVCPHWLHLNKRSRKRYHKKVAQLEHDVLTGDITERQCHDSLQAMLAFVNKANSRKYLLRQTYN